ncbi:MAG TPA: hypothetical protein VH575_34885 [Gemmataceae bacterium]|jgi:hypothetical protein
MRIRHRLQRLEQRAAARRRATEVEAVEIWIPDDGRNGRSAGRYPCEGTPNVVVIYEPTPTSQGGQNQS